MVLVCCTCHCGLHSVGERVFWDEIKTTKSPGSGDCLSKFVMRYCIVYLCASKIALPPRYVRSSICPPVRSLQSPSRCRPSLGKWLPRTCGPCSFTHSKILPLHLVASTIVSVVPVLWLRFLSFPSYFSHTSFFFFEGLSAKMHNAHQ